MHFHPHRPSRDITTDVSRTLKVDRELGLSFLYRSSKDGARLSYAALPTYHSLATAHMPYQMKNPTTRSVHSNFQIVLYNFLERPAGVKCFLYHFTVYVSAFFRGRVRVRACAHHTSFMQSGMRSRPRCRARRRCEMHLGEARQAACPSCSSLI